MPEITNEQKLYVLLKYKKSRTRCEEFQMLLIKFFNSVGDSWEGRAYSLCESSGQIDADEPNEEQLKIYGTRGKLHKFYPPYTQSSDVYLKELWRRAPSNPKNWWRTVKGLGAIVSIITITSGLWLAIKAIYRSIASIL